MQPAQPASQPASQPSQPSPASPADGFLWIFSHTNAGRKIAKMENSGVLHRLMLATKTQKLRILAFCKDYCWTQKCENG